MLTHDNLATTTVYLKDFVPSKPIPPSYKVTIEELAEILSASKNRLTVLEYTYHYPVIDEEKMTISSLSEEYVSFPKLFGEKSVLGKVLFPKNCLDQLDNSYLERLEAFLDDLNNEDNLLGAGFTESYLILYKVTDGPFKTKKGDLDGPDDGIVIWIF